MKYESSILDSQCNPPLESKSNFHRGVPHIPNDCISLLALEQMNCNLPSSYYYLLVFFRNKYLSMIDKRIQWDYYLGQSDDTSSGLLVNSIGIVNLKGDNFMSDNKLQSVGSEVENETNVEIKFVLTLNELDKVADDTDNEISPVDGFGDCFTGITVEPTR